MKLKFSLIICLAVAMATFAIYFNAFNLFRFKKATYAKIPVQQIFKYIKIIPPKLTVHNYLSAILKSADREMIIYVHYSGDLITNYILRENIFEPTSVKQFESHIKSHPGIQVLDLGCNLGIYTLTAAALGCTVVCVDANINNTARVMQSLLANGLSSRTTVCLNAVSNNRKRFAVRLVSDNIGGSHVIEVEKDTNSVDAILIDDLIPFFDDRKPIAIKIDIETKEIDAVKGASKFFDKHNVNYVAMEWEYIKHNPEIKFVINFFSRRGFKPFPTAQKLNMLNVSNYLTWPVDMFWLK